MQAKLSAPVGDPKCKDPKPKNTPADVATLEIFMIAQGYPYKMQGKMNSALIKLIKMVQASKKGRLEQTGVVVPGDVVWKGGQARYKRYRDEIAKFEAYEVMENGRPKRIPVHEYIRLEIEARDKIRASARAMKVDCTNIQIAIDKAHKTATDMSHMWNAWAQNTSNLFNPIPSDKAAKDAAKAVDAVIKELGGGKTDWNKLQLLLRAADKKRDAAVAEWRKYSENLIGAADNWTTGATIVREGAFVALEVLATGYLVTTKGMNPTAAHGLAAGGCEALKVGAGEFGEYAANDKFDPAASGLKVVGSASVAMLSGMVGGKLGGKMGAEVFDKASRKLSSYLSAKLSPALVPHAQKIVEKMLSSRYGQELISSAVQETINLFKVPVEKGRAPKPAEIVTSVVTAITGGFVSSRQFKSVEKLGGNWLNTRVLRSGDYWDWYPRLVRNFRKSDTSFDKSVELLLKDAGQDLFEAAASKYSGKISSTMSAEIVKQMTGEETSVKDFEKLAGQAIANDKALQKKIDSEIFEKAKGLVRQKIPSG